MIKFIKKLLVAPISILFYSFTILVWLFPLGPAVRLANWLDHKSNQLMVWAMKEKKGWLDYNRRARREMFKNRQKKNKKKAWV